MLPNVLTVSRIVFIPVIIACFYIGSRFSMYTAFGVFIAACITDFLDGYLARLYKQMSNFGRCFDPIADKLLVSTLIVLLAGFQHINGLNLIAAIVILFREIFVSGMREFLVEIKVPLPVSRLAKVKTTVQMLSLAMILFALAEQSQSFFEMGILLLWIAAVLTIVTGYQYFAKGIRHLDME